MEEIMDFILVNRLYDEFYYNGKTLMVYGGATTIDVRKTLTLFGLVLRFTSDIVKFRVIYIGIYYEINHGTYSTKCHFPICYILVLLRREHF